MCIRDSLVLAFAQRYALGLDAPWYLLSLAGVGYVPWFAVVVALAWIAIAAQFAALAAGRYAPYPDAQDRTGRRPLRQALAAARARRVPPDEQDVSEA